MSAGEKCINAIFSSARVVVEYTSRTLKVRGGTISQANRYLGGFCSSQSIFPPQIIQVLLLFLYEVLRIMHQHLRHRQTDRVGREKLAALFVVNLQAVVESAKNVSVLVLQTQG